MPIPTFSGTGTLGDQLTVQRITHVMTIPTLLSAIPQDQLPARVISTGEALPAVLVARLTADRIIQTLYGPGEFILHGLSAAVVREALADRSIPVAHANHGVAAYMLDHRLRPVPSAIIGEIYIAGTREALGYLDDCAGTATAFVACPWWPGHRMCRTGDLGRIDATTGEIHYHCRNDDQLSLHRVRVEPGEIERVAAGLDDVVDAAVVGASIPVGLNGNNNRYCEESTPHLGESLSSPRGTARLR